MKRHRCPAARRGATPLFATILLAVATVSPGCTAAIPDGRYACATTADCPPGFGCRGTRCFRGAVDAGGAELGQDAGPSDAGRDAPMDGPRSCSSAADCDDGQPCTVDSCVGIVCGYSFEPAGTSCSDGAFCNGAEVCAGGECVDQDDPCTTDNCDEPNDWCTCDDGNQCTGPDHFESATCVGAGLADARVCTGCASPGNCGCCGGSCVEVNITTGPCGSCGNSCTVPESCMPCAAPARYCCT